MVEQTPVAEDEPKPEEPKPADDPPAAIGTNIQGDGPPDGFGLSGKGGTGTGGTGRGLGGSGRSASRWGWYAAKVQNAVGDALRRNPRTRDAVLSEKVRVWPDANGRITRAKLADSTGDAALDAAITAALTGVQLPEPPPADMPSPILLRLAARRP
jgi:TonB family protein